MERTDCRTSSNLRHRLLNQITNKEHKKSPVPDAHVLWQLGEHLERYRTDVQDENLHLEMNGRNATADTDIRSCYSYNTSLPVLLFADNAGCYTFCRLKKEPG